MYSARNNRSLAPNIKLSTPLDMSVPDQLKHVTDFLWRKQSSTEEYVTNFKQLANCSFVKPQLTRSNYLVYIQLQALLHYDVAHKLDEFLRQNIITDDEGHSITKNLRNAFPAGIDEYSTEFIGDEEYFISCKRCLNTQLIADALDIDAHQLTTLINKKRNYRFGVYEDCFLIREDGSLSDNVLQYHVVISTTGKEIIRADLYPSLNIQY